MAKHIDAISGNPSEVWVFVKLQFVTAEQSGAET